MRRAIVVRESGRSRESRAPKIQQLTFPRRGGARRGAGCKPKGAKALVSHDARPPLAARFPVLVTMKLQPGLPSLRHHREREVIREGLRAARDRHGMRLVHFSIQSNHIHALIEASDAQALSRGMQGLSVRIARALNRAWGRVGRIFADRYHARILRSPREVRYALAYVLNNARKHGVHVGGIDPYSSGAAFDGWRNRMTCIFASALPVSPPHSWLLSIGWRRHGRIGVDEVPGRSP